MTLLDRDRGKQRNAVGDVAWNVFLAHYGVYEKYLGHNFFAALAEILDFETLYAIAEQGAAAGAVVQLGSGRRDQVEQIAPVPVVGRVGKELLVSSRVGKLRKIILEVLFPDHIP